LMLMAVTWFGSIDKQLRGYRMIDLYTWATPNGWKASIMLEECGLDYNLNPINIRENQNLLPSYSEINPNQKIPAIIDREDEDNPLTIYESGAILMYLADKTGKFLESTGQDRIHAIQWLMWQVSNVGPMLGQWGFFTMVASEDIPYAKERYLNESIRLIKILEQHLEKNEYLSGDYSIADMANYTWISIGVARIEAQNPEKLGELANTRRWIDTIGKRPAVIKGMNVPHGLTGGPNK